MIFIAYLLYGLARPLISQAWRQEIEDEEDEAEAAADNRGARSSPQACNSSTPVMQEGFQCRE